MHKRRKAGTVLLQRKYNSKFTNVILFDNKIQSHSWKKTKKKRNDTPFLNWLNLTVCNITDGK